MERKTAAAISSAPSPAARRDWQTHRYQSARRHYNHISTVGVTVLSRHFVIFKCCVLEKLVELEDIVFQGFNVYILRIDFNSGNKQHAKVQHCLQYAFLLL